MYLLKRGVLINSLAWCVVQATNQIVSISPELTYLLPPTYSGNLEQGFVDTNATDAAVNTAFPKAQRAPFIAYDPEFAAILGPNATLNLVAERDSPFAGEAGIWVPNRNEVWFTSNTQNDSESLMVLDLDTSKTYTPRTSAPVVNPNGGYYFNGTVYVAGLGTWTEAPCIYAINASNGNTTMVLNTYFGLQFNGPNDITWVKRGDKGKTLQSTCQFGRRHVSGSSRILSGHSG